MKNISLLVLLMCSVSSYAEDTAPGRVKNYLDNKYPGWVLSKIDKEECPHERSSSIIQGDFDGDGRMDYSVQITQNHQVFLLALLGTGVVYILHKNSIARNLEKDLEKKGFDTSLWLKKKGSSHADLERQYHFSQDTVEYQFCGRGRTFYTFNKGKWKEFDSSDD